MNCKKENYIKIVMFCIIMMLFPLSCFIKEDTNNSNNTEANAAPPTYTEKLMGFIKQTFNPDKYENMNNKGDWETGFTGNYFYIDPVNGDDNNDGSLNNPWKNLQQVITSKIKSYNAQENIINESGPVTAGDAIILLDGNYGEITINNIFNDDYIIISSQNPKNAFIDSLTVKYSKNWWFDGVSFSSTNPSDTTYAGSIIRFDYQSDGFTVSNVIIENSDIVSSHTYATWNLNEWQTLPKSGLKAYGNNFLFRNNTFKTVYEGLVCVGNNIIVENNHIEYFTIDGVRIWGNDITIKNNIIKNPAYCYVSTKNHYDGIQILDSNYSFYRINLIGNKIIENDNNQYKFEVNYFQGIGSFGSKLIECSAINNVVLCKNYHGITFTGAINSKIINNTIMDITGTYNSWIQVDDDKYGNEPSGNIVRNNLVKVLVIKEGAATVDNNLTFTSAEDHFVDYINNNMKLKQTSTAIDQGSSDNAPTTDIDGVARPQGNGYDIGAYEYK